VIDMDYFKRFIKEEYEWVYWNSTDGEKMLIENLDNKVSIEEFENNFDLFTTEAMLRFTNNDFVIEHMHELMDDMLYDVLEEYSNDKEKFLEENKLDDVAIRCELEEEIVNAYKTLTLYNISEEVLVNRGYIDKEKNDLMEEVGRLMDNEKTIASVEVIYKYDNGEEYAYEFTKNDEKEQPLDPSWIREIKN
jgi:hypothetical protein